MDGSFTDKLVIDPSELLGGVEDFELSESDKEELEKRGNQLREGIQQLAQRLFAQASEAAKQIQEAHKEHLGRLAKKRKTDEGAAPGADGGGGAEPAAAAPAAGSVAAAAQPTEVDAEAAASAALRQRAAKIIQHGLPEQDSPPAAA
eukprot:3393351-Pyramimonas_sp.AAC.1